MALTKCADCGHDMSVEALACPQCGKPNKKARNKAENSKQAVGCAFILLSLVLAIFLPAWVAGVVFVVGLVVVLLNTRFM